MSRHDLPAEQLRAGDRTLGSGITITSVSRGGRTPSGKVDVTGVRSNGRPFFGQWGRATIINVEREAVTA